MLADLDLFTELQPQLIMPHGLRLQVNLCDVLFRESTSKDMCVDRTEYLEDGPCPYW